MVPVLTKLWGLNENCAVGTLSSKCFSVQCSLFAPKMFPDIELFLLKHSSETVQVTCLDITTLPQPLCLENMPSAFLNSAFKFLFWIILCLSLSLFLSVVSVCLCFCETKPGIHGDPDIGLPLPPACWDKRLAPPNQASLFFVSHEDNFIILLWSLRQALPMYM